MAIYGIGSKYNDGNDVTEEYISNGVAGTGWDREDAPDVWEYFISLKVGDIVYLKSANPSSDITVKAIGIIWNATILSSEDFPKLFGVGRQVRWIYTEQFIIDKPDEKNNVRMNTIYQEFHPDVQGEIIERIVNR